MKPLDSNDFDCANHVYGSDRPAPSLQLDYCDGILTLKLGSEILCRKASVLPKTINISLKDVFSASASCATRTSNGSAVTICQLHTRSTA